ncbi:hypothetical protein HPB47_004814 [Ixodes persulcatus]|uniref:Uncharacterized protein n=1 Tax=Ixodes persulcatus TaxID=34615 RepID=A0AC60PFK3_IXOPE|nr:hypothetical protein HPB47_004814 [Ixodes persulcatus]
MRAIKSHMPYDQDRVSKHAKYIYVARNPYDCCVSFFNHSRHLPVYRFEDETFEEFFELFRRARRLTAAIEVPVLCELCPSRLKMDYSRLYESNPANRAIVSGDYPALLKFT